MPIMNFHAEETDKMGLFFQYGSASPMTFALKIENADTRTRLQNMIRSGGGVVVDDGRERDNVVVLIDSTKKLPRRVRSRDEVFDCKYVEDCYEKDERVRNMLKYRVNNHSKYGSYDPLSILLGLRTWSEIPMTRCHQMVHADLENFNIVDVSDIDSSPTISGQPEPNASPAQGRLSELMELDEGQEQINEGDPEKRPNEPMEADDSQEESSGRDFVETASAKESADKEAKSCNVKKLQRHLRVEIEKWADSAAKFSHATKPSRQPYTRSEKATIVRDIVETKSYAKLKGNEYWKELERDQRACYGRRSWQSMKEHFKKQIVPILPTFGLTDSQLSKFSRALNETHALPLSDDSEDDSEDDIEEETSEYFRPGTDNSSTPSKKAKEPDDVDEPKESQETSNDPRTRKRKLYQQNSLMNETPEGPTQSSPADEIDPEVTFCPQPSTSGFKKPLTNRRKLSRRSNSSENLALNLSDEDDDDEDDEEDRMSIESSVVSSATKNGKRPYTHAEDEKIAAWIAKNKRFNEVGGRVMWELMEEKNVLPGRSGQSMKERFRKHILPRIQHFHNLGETEVDAFESLKRRKKVKRPKK